MSYEHDTKLLVDMLTYKRPSRSQTEQDFVDEFIEPIMGKPDIHGNYVKVIPHSNGLEPTVIFTAHYDTVHKTGGRQKVVVTDGIVSLPSNSDSNCLGADCTTGVWLVTGMILAGVPGVYVIHADEESGCIGSSAFVEDNKFWLEGKTHCISFDRFGTGSVITHQCGMRTSSDEFATSFAKALRMDTLKPDSTGVFTDSNEYAFVVPECTNISVGYYNQHTKSETQDLRFAENLLDSLVDADWSKLVSVRDPAIVEYDNYGENMSYSYTKTDEDDVKELMGLMEEYPYAIAKVLVEYGLTADALVDDMMADDEYAQYFRNYY